MGIVNFLIKMGLDTTEVNIGTKRVESAFTGMGGTVKKVLGGLFTVGAATAYAKTLLTVADNMTDMADTLGITRQELQSLEAAAASGGGSMEQLTQSLLKVTEARDKAMGGGEAGQKMLQSFAALGVSERDVLDKSLRHYDILTKISEKIGSSNTSFDEQTALIDIIGIKSAKLRNTLSDLSKETPITFVTEKELTKLDDVNRKMEIISTNARNYAASRLAAAATTQEDFAKAFGGGKLATFASGPFAVAGEIVEFIANAFGGSTKMDQLHNKPLPLPDKTTGKYDGPADISYVSGNYLFGKSPIATFADKKKKRDLEKELEQTLSGSGFGVDSAVTRGAFFGGSDRQAQLGAGMNALKFRIEKLTEQIAEVNEKLDSN